MPNIPHKNYLVTGLLSICALAMTTTTIFFYIKYEEVKRVAGAEVSDAEIGEVVKKVERHIVLPKNETPTLATVSEKEKLSGQQFFAMSENGDKVLVYVNSKKAILYRPRIDKIIEVSPITVNEDQTPLQNNIQSNNRESTNTTPVTSQASTQPETISVEIRNGSQIAANLSIIQERLRQQSGISLASVDTDAKREYDRTIVYLINKDKESRAKEIAASLKSVYETELPSDEPLPEADILVIIGSDISS